MELVIMAAGMGSRFGGMKQLEPIDNNGNFIIDYSIYDAIRCGFDKIIFIIKKENFELFRETIGKRVEKQIKTVYVFQNNDNIPAKYQIPADRIKPFGTAHAILCAKDAIKSDFAVINADDFYGYDAFKTVAEFLKTNKNPDVYGLVGYKALNTLSPIGDVKRGICNFENNKLDQVVECLIKKVGDKQIASPLDPKEGNEFEVKDDTIASMNMFGFTTKFLDYLYDYFIRFLDDNKDNLKSCEFYLTTLLSQLIEENKVRVNVLKTSAKWYGLTFREDKDNVVSSIKALVDEGQYPLNLWKK